MRAASVDRGAGSNGRLGEPGKAPLTNFKYLINPKSSWKKEAHVHPFLSSAQRERGAFGTDSSRRGEKRLAIGPAGVVGSSDEWVSHRPSQILDNTNQSRRHTPGGMAGN